MSVGQQQHLHDLQLRKSTPMVARSKAWIYAVRLLRLRVRIPPATWLSVSCKCCVLSGRDLCVGLIFPSEKSYGVFCVQV